MRKLCSVLFALAALAAPTLFTPSVGHADPYGLVRRLRRRSATAAAAIAVS